MEEFEGSLILEKLAEIQKLDEFYSAIDSDDFSKMKELMKEAGVDLETQQWAIQKAQLVSFSF